MSKSELLRLKFPRWTHLPSLPLYMDQVLAVIEDAVGPACGDDAAALKATMVNNYVKMKIIPPSVKKKYTREQLSALIIITLLKRVLSMSEISVLLDSLYAGLEPEHAYDLFCGELEDCIRETAAGEACVRPDSFPLLAAAVRCLAAKLLFEAEALEVRGGNGLLPPDSD